MTKTSTTSTGKGISASDAYPCSPCTVSAFGWTGTIRLPKRWSTAATPYAARDVLFDRPTTAQVSPLSVRIFRTVAASPYTPSSLLYPRRSHPFCLVNDSPAAAIPRTLG